MKNYKRDFKKKSFFLFLSVQFIIFFLTLVSAKADPPQEDMVFIKGGCFEMGDLFGDGLDDEKPVHEVCVDDFYLGEHEVTVGEFREFVNQTAYRTQAEKKGGCLHWIGSQNTDKNAYWDEPGFLQDERNPVICISWKDATEYIKWKKQKTGLNYRLPTEAEWEYAARGGGMSEKYAGFSNEEDLYLYSNFCDLNCDFSWKTKKQDDGSQYTALVKSYRPNSLGLYDMSGNVWEWVQDWYGKDAYSNSPRNNPTGPMSGEDRVLRGGSWSSIPWFVRSAIRPRWTEIGLDTGFRVARDPMK